MRPVAARPVAGLRMSVGVGSTTNVTDAPESPLQESDPSDGFTKHAVAEIVCEPAAAVGGSDTVNLALHERGSTAVVPSAVSSHRQDTRL